MRMTKAIENLQYIVLVGLIVAQCVVGNAFFLGQSIYLAVNIVSVFRSFALKRPAADKVKDCSCLAITIGIILFRILA